MNIAKIETARKNANVKQFKKAADYITQKYVSDPTNGPALDAEARAVISEVTAEDMATGAKLVKGKYILIGVLIGVAVVTLAVIAINVSSKGES